MFENENKNDFTFDGNLDLGSVESDFGFTPFEDKGEADAIFANSNQPEEKSEEKTENTADTGKAENIPAPAAETIEEAKNETVANSETVQAADSTDKSQALWSELMAQEDEKQAEIKKNGLIQKLPIFEYGDAKEEIVDTSKTFEELRLEKSDDFPELDEGGTVEWKVTYGSIVKKVATPKKTTVASIKTQIEESADFMKMLKKPDDNKKTKKSKGEPEKKEIECIIKPLVTSKKKGVMAQYKGLFPTVEEAQNSGKVISFVPSKDGRVFEVRSNKIGTFIAPTENVIDFQKVRAGFIPALPKIPYNIWSDIIAFFKSFIGKSEELEALAYIYWSFEEERYYVVVPKQKVSKDRVDAVLPDMDEDKWLLAAEIHSHNTMNAYFSHIDDKDEKATRIYIVVGRMDKIFPDVEARISCGGKFVKIEPSDIMEGYTSDYPCEWKESVEKIKLIGKEADV